MKSTTSLAAAIVASLVFSLSLAAQTAKSSSPSPTPSASPSKQPARPIPFHGMVSAVDQKSKTFTISGKEATRVFKVTDKTSIMKGAAAGTMKDIADNEEVLVDVRALGQMTSSAVLRRLPHSRATG
jgi:hypothetical protein